MDGRDPQALHAAARRLAAGELVAFPTETVYGLGARADDDTAVARVFEAKGRPADHPLIVHVADRDAAAAFSPDLGAAAQRLMAAFWPGPLTVIVTRRPGRALAAAGGQPTIGLRMPAHPVALALLRSAQAMGVAGIAGPSANRFGHLSPTAAAHVEAEFGRWLAVLDGGPCDVGIESAIVDCSGERPALLRPGQLAQARIEAALGMALQAPNAHSPRAPGRLASHYAPVAPVVLFDALPVRAPLAATALRPQSLVGVYSQIVPEAGAGWLHRTMPADAAAAAHELFAVLREFDAAGVAAIWVQRPPASPEWDGVRDRLQRAAA